MAPSRTDLERVVFRTGHLGWMAMVGAGEELMRLVFRGDTAQDAEKSLGEQWLERSTVANWNEPLRYRLCEYAWPRYMEFDDVPVLFEGASRFALKVYAEVQKVRYGKQATYGQVASRLENPGATRAVGRILAMNPIPIVVPCHRIVLQSGDAGQYSGPGGAETKRNLLLTESMLAP